MNRLVLSAAAAALGLLLVANWSDTASAERRVALVIGNSAYQNALKLPNPTTDAKAMAAALKQAGFDVVSTYSDVGNLQFKRALRQFEDIAGDADISIVFYAGHGIEIRGVNYMIPVDARLASDRDADDEAITLERLLESVQATRRLSLIILDACRDNPFVQTMKRHRTATLRAISPGLALVGPTTRNMLIAYAAKSGTAAEDGDMQHSPFTAALLNQLFVPGLELRLAFGRVRDEVLKSTAGRQEPFVSGSLGGDHISLVPAGEEPTKADAMANPADEKSDYDLVKKIGSKGAWEVFLNQYPSGLYADLARQQLRKLEPSPQAEAQRVAAEPEALSMAALTPSKPPSPLAEREAQAAEAARKKAEVERTKREEAARQKAETERAQQEAADRAKQEAAAEASRQQAERKELRRREEDERQAKAAEAAERQKAERDVGLRGADQERRAAVGTKQDAGCGREEELLVALKAVGDQGWARADLKRLEQQLTCERLRPEVLAALAKTSTEPALHAGPRAVEVPKPASNTERAEEERRAAVGPAQPDAGCRREEELLAALKAGGDQGWARADLKRLEQRLTCERLRPEVLAALAKATAKSD